MYEEGGGLNWETGIDIYTQQQRSSSQGYGFPSGHVWM